MGKVGVRALITRALALAKTEVTWLRAVEVKADGALEVSDEIEAQVGPKEMAEGGVVLVVRLLRLMETLIGENLTRRMVHQAWPKLSLSDLDFGKE